MVSTSVNPRKMRRNSKFVPVFVQNPFTDALLQDSPIFQLQVTFAALQESIQKIYNPEKLAESLRLCTTEQQDAQELV